MGVVAKILWRTQDAAHYSVRSEFAHLAWSRSTYQLLNSTHGWPVEKHSKLRQNITEAAVRANHFRNEVTDHYYQDQCLFFIALRLVKTNDDAYLFSLEVLLSIGKGAIPRILPRNEKPDMLLDKAGTRHEAKKLSPSLRQSWKPSWRFRWGGW